MIEERINGLAVYRRRELSMTQFCAHVAGSGFISDVVV